ncbi:hypothetical protein GGR55DRAFT_547900 [Xylaria sp. FL0064]|nr:hypothetical protein GGR55DRAFT_547900 [Xylaria sp. FL0064]
MRIDRLPSQYFGPVICLPRCGWGMQTILGDGFAGTYIVVLCELKSYLEYVSTCIATHASIFGSKLSVRVCSNRSNRDIVNTTRIRKRCRYVITYGVEITRFLWQMFALYFETRDH